MLEEHPVYKFRRKSYPVDLNDIVFLEHETYDDEVHARDFIFELADDGSYVAVTSLNGATPQGIETIMGNYGFVPLNPVKRAAKSEPHSDPRKRR